MIVGEVDVNWEGEGTEVDKGVVDVNCERSLR